MPQSPRILVTGATGQLGALVIDALLKTVPASAVIAGVRDPAKPAAVALREQGVEVRVADYARPETLAAALAGVDRLLLVSGNEIGHRKAQHRHVIDAARQAGVGLIAYTSILHADTTPLFLADEHRDTEAALKASGVPYVLLRNGWYTEVHTWRLPAAMAHGVLIGAAGDGRTASAARADYAAAAAAVLTGEGHAGRTYELAGDTGWTLAGLAAEIARQSGRPVAYRDLPQADYAAMLVRLGLPAGLAGLLADADAQVAEGALLDEGHALSRLIGRPTTPVSATVAAALRG